MGARLQLPPFKSQWSTRSGREGPLSTGRVSRNWTVSSKGRDGKSDQAGVSAAELKIRRIRDSVLNLKETQGS